MVILEAKNIWKSLGRKIVLRGASLSIEEGERVVILGENGSGKSTLLQIIAGLLEPDSGQVTVHAGPTGFAPEKPDMPDHLLVGEWLDVIASLKGLSASTLTIDLGTDALRRKMAKALSLGQKQRVSLATAWMGPPRLLILDEPTNALDQATRAMVLDGLEQSTAIIATHDREVAERIATRIVTVSGGLVS
jgi:ABC-type multidrug transport system ATPase subunit